MAGLRRPQKRSPHALIGAQRALFHGPATLVRLRVWVFIELMSLPQSRLSRDDLNRHFHVLRDEALELVLKRLRDGQLLAWDASNQQYGVTPLAQQLMAMVSPLTQGQGLDEDSDLAGLLANVAGAQQLGTLEPAQLQHLLAQLSRLYNEFADAIASGSEFRLRASQAKWHMACDWVEKGSAILRAITSDERADSATHKAAQAIGRAQSSLLNMQGMFSRALNQIERQRVHLGQSGLSTTEKC